MSDATIRVKEAPDNADAKLIDNELVLVGADTVFRQRVAIAGQTAAAIGRVHNSTPAPADYGMVVRVAESGATLNNGAETAVSATAIQVAAANANRRKLIIQNVGLNPVRVGVAGVTATTGVRLALGDTIIFRNPDCPTNAIFAIRDGLLDSTVLAQEVV